ncbi:TolC family protein [Runella sp. MFBS21]|uniref:TolC family protein n=1 Tax=Runella sp. MFBS21 TaxID=3034018 RepID=UPI0023F757BA|nr:TolC family protein [Runella sp. MFBS21]MDF7820266.1 TolC family protein [Runella sp. MFBS21]
MKKILFMGVLLSCLSAHAQQLLTETEAVETALKNSPSLKAGALNVRQNEQLVRSARNIPNPDVTFDSPTGDFYTLGVQQTLRFPTVYKHQAQLQSQQIGLAQKEQAITQNDLKWRVKSIYLMIQAAQANRAQIAAQDSVYEQIRQAAKRQFEAGTIDKLALTFAEMQAAEVRNALTEATQQLTTAKAQLTILMQGNTKAEAVATEFNVSPLASMPVRASLSSDFTQNPLVQAAEQVEVINQKAIDVERANALPGFMVGYYNQGTKESNLGLRWRAGMSIPLWAGQYKSRISAAQTGYEIAKQRTEAQKVALATDLQAAEGELIRYRNTLTYFQTVAIGQAEELISTARRLFESGQTDYIGFLRTTNDAYNIKLRYLETLRSYHQTLLTVNYLTGNL